MSVRVTATTGEVSVFDNADKWVFVDSPSGPRIDIVKTANGGNPTDKVVGSFAPAHWDSVRLTAKEDRAALLADATELIKDVDDGNFGHQSTEWQDRAEKFLLDVA